MTFALIDCNNFYASCERAFNPKLIGRPIAVLSNNDGCIIARSNETKSLGIPMGAPVFKYRDIIEKNNVHMCSSNYTLYGDISARIMNVLKDLAPHVEVYSIDEAFLSFSNATADLMGYASYIKQIIKDSVGIPVSIGIAPTKTLAKVANHLAKKGEGVFDIRDENVREEVLKKFKVADIWGIGRKLSGYLNDMGIKSATELRDFDISTIRRRFTVVGERTVRELRGEVCYHLEENPEPKKGIVCSRSFGKPVTEFEDLAEAVSTHAARCCET